MKRYGNTVALLFAVAGHSVSSGKTATAMPQEKFLSNSVTVVVSLVGRKINMTVL